jgi:hypothetical protein
MSTIWELDFYSRPILDENKKKLWEVLIRESPISSNRLPDSLFSYSQFCPSTSVNSIWLSEAIQNAIAQAPQPPKKIRFFRRQMNNMIVKACNDLGITVAPSRRTYFLEQWLETRNIDFYPHQEGYEFNIAATSSVQYPETNAIPLPDAVRGDKSDKWAFVNLEAGGFEDMQEWDISFGESFPLSMMVIDPETRIPGLIIFSPRALPLAGWMSGVEMGYLFLEADAKPKIRLETGASDSWIVVNLTDKKTLAEAQRFEDAKHKANGVHFLAIQSTPESQAFAGFWLLKQ